jgi:hypothetical protein
MMMTGARSPSAARSHGSEPRHPRDRGRCSIGVGRAAHDGAVPLAGKIASAFPLLGTSATLAGYRMKSAYRPQAEGRAPALCLSSALDGPDIQHSCFPTVLGFPPAACGRGLAGGVGEKGAARMAVPLQR